MQFNYKYSGRSSIKNGAGNTGVSLMPDTLREPTFFVGSLSDKIPFREAISALHDIVVADFKFKPSDKTNYKAWLKEQEGLWLAEAMKGSDGLEQKIKQVQSELAGLQKERHKITGPFYTARSKYYSYLRKRDYAAWYVLDPVITVHPDQVFFECFSKDESVYGKLSCGYDVFKHISDFKCGTTNIDYSELLYDEFQKIRSYKTTDFSIDPGGFDVQTEGEAAYREVKIDLPDSWVRGFLQVSSAMTFNQVSFDLHPVDFGNFLFILKRNKERRGPRSIRYVLEPGKPVKAIFEPWNYEVICRKSIYEGSKAREIRVWGRRRLALMERVLPVARKISVRLLGNGMPSFYIADIGDMKFTMGLSGWTANDWTQVGNFDLLSPKGDVPQTTMQQIYLKLREDWLNTPEKLASQLELENKVVYSALRKFTQAGKVVYDLANKVYRIRELKRGGIDLDTLRFSSEVEKKGFELAQSGKAEQIKVKIRNGVKVLTGRIDGEQTELLIDKDERIIGGKCSCSYYFQNKLMKGPCEHMVALQILARQD
ncbi:MAG: SWIM zinc finger family protein [Bacteroidota bacterium]